MENPKPLGFAATAFLWLVAVIVVGGVAFYAIIMPFIALLRTRS